MKRTNILIVVLVVTFASIFACSEEYVDPTDNSLTGLWVVRKITDGNNVNDTSYKSQFISMREDVFYFHTDAVYDSSYFIKEGDGGDLFYQKINDIERVIRKYDSIVKVPGKNDTTFHKVDTLYLPQKPINPDHSKVYNPNYLYYASYSFRQDTLVFKFYEDNTKKDKVSKIIYFGRATKE